MTDPSSEEVNVVLEEMGRHLERVEQVVLSGMCVTFHEGGVPDVRIAGLMISPVTLGTLFSPEELSRFSSETPTPDELQRLLNFCDSLRFAALENETPVG